MKATRSPLRPPLYFDALGDQLHSDVLGAAGLLEGLGFPRCSPDTDAVPAESRLPREFLQGILLGARLFRWEQDGVTLHLEAGLPSAEDHLVKVAQLFSGPELRAYVAETSALTRTLYFERFAWSGRDDLHAEIGIVAQEDDDFLDSLADFLWDHRHTLSHGDVHEEATQ